MTIKNVLLFIFLISWVAYTRAQLYETSVASTNFDFITDADISTFDRMVYVGKAKREMPDSRPGNPSLFQVAFVFTAYYKDNTQTEFNIDGDFSTLETAKTEAERYVSRFGKLPLALRKGVKRIVVHKGDGTFFSDNELGVFYSDKATFRISEHDLEESLFHEAVHAAWDKTHANSSGWIAAQKSDGGFITTYAKNNPKLEDLPESALFAYTITYHPERLGADAEKIRKAIPARIAYVAKLLPATNSSAAKSSTSSLGLSSKPSSSVAVSSVSSSSVSVKASSSAASSSSGTVTNCHQISLGTTKTEIDLGVHACVEWNGNLSGTQVAVWDSDVNTSCDFRGTLTSVNGSGSLSITSNYAESSSLTGTIVKFAASNGCNYLIVRAF